ncbi:hypothetical protein [Nostoc sp. KVJ20]|uniref:hypothetical protein n=1 Tax=Nostoc sp. KVJ20 TaxID=457944 RepID=UPI00159F005F|nr:hypothetical protein [Nostoc sp. KVJ20]
MGDGRIALDSRSESLQSKIGGSPNLVWAGAPDPPKAMAQSARWKRSQKNEK